MKQAERIKSWDTQDSINATIEKLVSLHHEAAAQLSECALHQPGLDDIADEQNSQKEKLYLDQQETILISAARAPMKQEEDVKNVLRLWLKEAPQDPEDQTIADQLVLSVCRHFKVA